jgi:hypothetical protein
MVREILQELEYNHANPSMDNAKAVQGATQVATHSRSTNESKAGQAQEIAGTVTIEKVHPFVLISS